MGGRRRAIGGGLLATAALAALALTMAPNAAAESVKVSPTGHLVVGLRGNGHGHGLSQYGARGAAIAGKSYQQIVGFYYPNTTLQTLPGWPTLRVLLSGCHQTTTVWPENDLTVTGISGTLPAAGVRYYRLVADASGITLQKVGTAPGSRWTAVATGLPDGTEFHRVGGASMRLLFSDGSSTRYYGYLRAVRTPSSDGTVVRTVNRVTYRSYTAGVVPREMPASWQRAAVDAQAVAARTYADYAVRHPSNPNYDICDTTQCQVYGGHIHYNPDGSVAYTDFWPAETDTANQVLRYQDNPVFAQYSASDGGWTVSGGQPYLVAQADPYDNRASGDPYLEYSTTIAVPSIARAFGLATVTGLSITARDGHGAWGGRVLAGTVTGTDASGAAKVVAVSGFDLQAAFGVGTTWMYLTRATA